MNTGGSVASNSFGTVFRITTWGESHGKAMGVVIDGCPAGLDLSEKDINDALALRAPGKNPYTSPRKEKDQAEIYSGIFEGKTTGAPIAVIIANSDGDSSKYESIKHILRPGHANYTYTEKYRIFDYRGGGRASARETVCRVAAGAVAQKILEKENIQLFSYLSTMGDVDMAAASIDSSDFQASIAKSSIFCPNKKTEARMLAALEKAQAAGDSLGGIVTFCALHLPVGLGEPLYEKIEAKLAYGMLSLPASKGFEIGEGFNAARMGGSVHNDVFKEGPYGVTETNHGGGTLGGITTGMPLMGRVAFKPTSSIKKPQNSIDYEGNPQTLVLPKGSRHDPCVAIRAVPVVNAMCALVLADALLMNRCARIE